ncbi:MAG: polysaccharide pyruvyl transferase family protein [Bacteroidales bacterium]|nr:polysaccharide pyruvyl transferase family protein [Bacteroidales bacterium]
MKILIITFTGGVNPGTFMQALGVQTALKKIYPQAIIEYLRFPDFKRGGLMVRGKRDALWYTFLQKGYAAYRLIKYQKLRRKHFIYTQNTDLFEYSDASVEWIKKYDLVVVGSDTILEKAYNEHGKIGLNWMPLDVPKIYFAASASPANFVPNKDLKLVAENAKFIGLRDSLTISFFKDQLGVSSDRLIKQPDPSYFLDIKKFQLSERLRSRIKSGEKYVLYNFNSNFPHRQDLADMLRKLGYNVVSTAYNPYADICMDTVDAYEWAGVFPLMDLVVTERFHDSVFALRNCKPVIAIDWEKNRFASKGDSKTFRILEDYNLNAFHFNLAESSDLSPICRVIEKIDTEFNQTLIKQKNEFYMESANNILSQIAGVINL